MVVYVLTSPKSKHERRTLVRFLDTSYDVYYPLNDILHAPFLSYAFTECCWQISLNRFTRISNDQDCGTPPVADQIE